MLEPPVGRQPGSIASASHRNISHPGNRVSNPRPVRAPALDWPGHRRWVSETWGGPRSLGPVAHRPRPQGPCLLNVKDGHETSQ